MMEPASFIASVLRQYSASSSLYSLSICILSVSYCLEDGGVSAHHFCLQVSSTWAPVTGQPASNQPAALVQHSAAFAQHITASLQPDSSQLTITSQPASQPLASQPPQPQCPQSQPAISQQPAARGQQPAAKRGMVAGVESLDNILYIHTYIYIYIYTGVGCLYHMGAWMGA